MKKIKNVKTNGKRSTIVNLIRSSRNYLSPVLCFLFLGESVIKKANVIRVNLGKAKYDDAVNAITDSDMWSADKLKAINALKKDGDSKLYKSVVNVVHSSMWSKDKLTVIENMCKD